MPEGSVVLKQGEELRVIRGDCSRNVETRFCSLRRREVPERRPPGRLMPAASRAAALSQRTGSGGETPPASAGETPAFPHPAQPRAARARPAAWRSPDGDL